MSCNPVLSISGISKFFEIYQRPSHRLFQMICRGKRQFFTPFWALKDISFEVNRGDCIGIIGKNGAGKSTLLQVITGTLSPSSGSVSCAGRIAALLELGSGFNPEFTGLENIYLNASILGLNSHEIDEQLDKIIKFADIGEFLHQPIKTYSSGMVVRLAFAVVAHVNADILIIDEALAVGDAFFTQKCMRFLRNFLRTGTILFVSHDAAAVNSLCNRAILLESGTIKICGSPKEVTEMYLKDMYEAQQGAFSENNSAVQQFIFSNESRRDMRQDFFNSTNLRNDIQVFTFEPNEADFGAGGVTIEHVTLTDKDNIPLSWIVGGESVALKIFLLAKKDVYSPIVGFFVKNYLGQNLFGDNTYLTYQRSPVRVSAGEMFEASFCFTMPILEKGDFSFSVAVAEGTQENHIQHDWKHDALIIRSVASSCATGMIGIPMQHIEIKNGSSGENFNNAKGSG